MLRRRVGIATVLLAALGFAGTPVASAEQWLTCAGASAGVPPGWHGDVSRGSSGGFTLLVATVPLAARKGDVLGGTLEHLDRGGVLVALLSYGRVDATSPAYTPLPSALTTRAMPHYAMFEGMPQGDRVARRSFRARGAGYEVQVYFAAEEITPRLRARADAVVAAFRFAKAPPQPTRIGAPTRC